MRQGKPPLAFGLTGLPRLFNIQQLMSTDFPEVVDGWRMAAARQGFEGELALSSLARLRPSLADAEGAVRFSADFDRNVLQQPFVALRIVTRLPLRCQRSLQRFEFPVEVSQRLALIRDEADEAALPEDYEPLLLPADGLLHLADLVEDELILALPVVPVAPESEAIEGEFAPDPQVQAAAGPFAALQVLRSRKS